MAQIMSYEALYQECIIVKNRHPRFKFARFDDPAKALAHYNRRYRQFSGQSYEEMSSDVEGEMHNGKTWVKATVGGTTHKETEWDLSIGYVRYMWDADMGKYEERHFHDIKDYTDDGPDITHYRNN